MVSARHAQARGLFEREGYLSIREVWRVTLDLVESSSNGISHPGRCAIEIDGASGQLVGTTSLYDREGVYSVRQFLTYEKELCLAGEACDCPGESAETLIGV